MARFVVLGVLVVFLPIVVYAQDVDTAESPAPLALPQVIEALQAPVGKHIFCFGTGRYMEIIIPPGEYKLQDFGPLEFHPGELVYLRQIPALPVKQNLVRTGGGIFEFFLPQMKPIPATDAEKRRKNDIKGPVAKAGEVHG